MRNWVRRFWEWFFWPKPKCDYCEQPAVWEWRGRRSSEFTEIMQLCERCTDRRTEVAKTLRFISWSTTKL